MLRFALATILVDVAAAGLASECMKGLQLLEGEDDFELAVRCRAAFSPEACTQARQALGAQPWTGARMKQSCHRFASTFQGMDERALDAAMGDKHSQWVPTQSSKMDEATLSKPPMQATPALPQQPQAPVAGILNKLKERKHKQDEQKPKGAVAGLLDKLKKAKEPKSDVDDKGDQTTGPLANMLQKMKEAKQAKEASAMDGQMKLYGDVQLEQPAPTSSLPQVFGALGLAACIAGLTLLLASRRARPALIAQELTGQEDILE